MTRHYLTIFKRRRSHYISWNILFLWGFGLWIALCTTVLFYQQNLNLGIACNISTNTETMEDMLYIMASDYTLNNTTLILRAMLKHIHIFAFICFVVLSIFMQERIRKKIEVWNNIFHRKCNSSSIISYLNSFVREHKENNIFNDETNGNDHLVLQCELSLNSKIDVEQNMLSYDQTKDDYVWVEEKNNNILNINITIVQNKIVFNGYTLLLFNNYELYQYFNNQQLKSTYSSLTRYLAVQNSKYIECDVKSSNEKINYLPLKKCVQKGVISSSPEFKKFLENLTRSQFFHPFMLEVSTSYIVCIKSIYK
uniref:uncharacterized protein LOC117602349 isoform X2 n=1 Tax=Osmia lignaria TaxID=473952 RepID=UPI00147826A7|nr:uncharacterized protein LOC117602349 isoform X2 [Osmia lignaria]